MKKVAIMLDAWKLKIFKKHLDGGSFSYKKHPGLTANTLMLKVETDDVPRLKTTVEVAQRECARVRMH